MDSLFPLPKQFDQNEWYVLLFVVIAYSTLFLLRKSIRGRPAVLLMLFTITVARVSDHILAWPDMDMYDVMDYGKYELFDVITYFLFAPFAVFFIYIYERFSIRGRALFLYIAAFALLSILVELTGVHFNVFTFKSWNSLYSYVFYLFMEIVLLYFYYLVSSKTGKLYTKTP